MADKKELDEALAYAKEQYDKLTPEQKKHAKQLRNRRDLLKFVWGDDLGKAIHQHEQDEK